ncbi:MAG TPA: hypothetical protein VGP68_18515 [Gemmataceae bacterium]|nr:hypothetical protein [Gemmataceae bacterium]
MTKFRLTSFVFCFLLVGGCSSAGPTKDDPQSTDFQELGELFHAAASKVGHAPTKLADLGTARGMFPKAYESVKSGEVIVLWGTSPKGEGDVGNDEVVLAYEKKVPTEGGYVLMSAGTVKKMTAAELNSAPKAGKK